MSEVKDPGTDDTTASIKMTGFRASTRAGFRSSTTGGLKASTSTGLRATRALAHRAAPAPLREPYDPDQ